MRKYVVTKINRNAVNGLIQKFIKSCERKQHVYKFNRQIVFPYLTDEQVKNAKFRLPVYRTCKFNGVRLGDTVTFCGGNRIEIKSRYGTDRFTRIVPKNADMVAKFISLLSRPAPMVHPEFLFDHVLTINDKKRYADVVPLTDAQSLKIADIAATVFSDLGAAALASFPHMVAASNLERLEYDPKQSADVEDFDDSSIYPVRPIRLELNPPSLTVAETCHIIDQAMKLGLVRVTPSTHKTAASSCESMYLDN